MTFSRLERYYPSSSTSSSTSPTTIVLGDGDIREREYRDIPIQHMCQVHMLWEDSFGWWRVHSRASSASSSHEFSLEPTPTRSVDLGENSVYTHFPKDRNCEICQRTKITRARCRRRNGEAVSRAENSGDLIKADHKVLSESCESRNNHRDAVVMQDLATQWIQSCIAKTSQETQRSLQQFLGARLEA